MSRREFLYDIKFWEARRIIRGYRRRGRIFMQLLAENVYASTFAFRGSEGKTVKDMFPSIFSDDNDDNEKEPQLTEDDRTYLQELMNEENKRMQAERESSEH
ncbi:MAG: hypothetical protein K6E67_10445 [Prevotella sp.]|nr:hypothetical protein [Prevotella sp.]